MRVLPQQQLLLELLMMSGEIAVVGDVEDTILWRTLKECRDAQWVSVSKIGPKLQKAEITATGRLAAKEAAAS